jgi:tryptophan synthase alpha chain
MNLREDILQRLQSKPILLMTHLVLGYPSLEVNRQVIRHMAANGVDSIELQIPFSEPMADGPVILKANQDALRSGIKVEDSFSFAADIIREFPGVNFLFMTYYNIIFRYGEPDFIRRAAEIGI